MRMTDGEGGAGRMVTDEHAISYDPNLFERRTGEHSDYLWLKDGTGYVNISTATAHSLEHNAPWEYSFTPAEGQLRLDGGFYKLKFDDGASFHITVIEIPAYYVD